MNYNTSKLVLISTASAQEKAQGTLENREDQNQENVRLALNIVLKPGFEGRGDQPRMDKLTIARLGNLVPRAFPHLFFNGKALGTRLKIGLQ